MEDLQGIVKTPGKKHRFTIHRIISRIEDRESRGGGVALIYKKTFHFEI